MKIIRRIMTVASRIVKKYYKRQSEKALQEKITRNFKDLKIRRKLTAEQEKEVNDFYVSIIGKKVPLYCHEYFYSRTGVFSKDYIPPEGWTAIGLK